MCPAILPLAEREVLSGAASEEGIEGRGRAERGERRGEMGCRGGGLGMGMGMGVNKSIFG